MRNRIIMVMAAMLLLSFVPVRQHVKAHETGHAIFSTHCTPCHGVDGAKGKWGAKNLQQSTLPDVALLNIVTRGKGIMPSWKNKLTKQEIELVIDYIKTLRQKL